MAKLTGNGERANWTIGVGVAAAAHLAALSFVLAQRGESAVLLPDPVMVVELPAGEAAASSEPVEEIVPQEQPQPLPDMAEPVFHIPEVDAPLPPDPVTVPTPRPLPQAVPVRPVVAREPVPAAARAPAPAAPVGDPAAKERERSWYSLVSAHLNRKKTYPREAKKAGQQGTPTVRFTVDRRGRVSNISIARSSGHELLDEATLSLIRRAAPLPAMPSSMGRETVTISLPIEYSLSRK